MLETGTILSASFGYIGLLFAIAYYGDKRADIGRSIISNPYIYALSLAVYCTAWTFYGSVGRAVNTGPGFLTIYIGPTLIAILGWFVLREIQTGDRCDLGASPRDRPGIDYNQTDYRFSQRENLGGK